MSRKRLFVSSVGLAATLIATSLAPVLASYPGAENGRIAFGVRAADGSANIFSALPDGTGTRQLKRHRCARPGLTLVDGGLLAPEIPSSDEPRFDGVGTP